MDKVGMYAVLKKLRIVANEDTGRLMRKNG